MAAWFLQPDTGEDRAAAIALFHAKQAPERRLEPFAIITTSESVTEIIQSNLEGTVADSKTPQDKMMAAMNGSGDAAKLSVSAAKALKKAALAKAMEAKKVALAKKPTAKVIPMKKATASNKAAKKIVPLKKAAANKKVVRKTMKTGKKAKTKSR